MTRRIIFESTAFEDFHLWVQQDKKLYKKIISPIKDIDRSPFTRLGKLTGLGKPKLLKHESIIDCYSLSRTQVNLMGSFKRLAALQFDSIPTLLDSILPFKLSTST